MFPYSAHILFVSVISTGYPKCFNTNGRQDAAKVHHFSSDVIIAVWIGVCFARELFTQWEIWVFARSCATSFRHTPSCQSDWVNLHYFKWICDQASLLECSIFLVSSCWLLNWLWLYAKPRLVWAPDCTMLYIKCRGILRRWSSKHSCQHLHLFPDVGLMFKWEVKISWAPLLKMNYIGHWNKHFNLMHRTQKRNKWDLVTVFWCHIYC